MLAERRDAQDAMRRNRGGHEPVEVEDLAKCRQCGAFVAVGARSCGKAACPYPR
jgi:hypothetical protein